MSMAVIDSGKGLINAAGTLVYVLRFESDNEIDPMEFVEEMQAVLYDEIGSTGHFRLAPRHKEDLNENFVLMGRIEDNHKEFMESNSNEVHVAFCIYQDLSETPLSLELSIIPKEVDEFCEGQGLRYEQVDVRTLYH
jgi:hypothetical protein